MVTDRRPRGIVLDDETRARLQILINRLGWIRTKRLIGVGQSTIENALRCERIFRTTATTIRLAVRAAGAVAAAQATTTEPQP